MVQYRTDLRKCTHLYAGETQRTKKHKHFRQKVFVGCKKTDNNNNNKRRRKQRRRRQGTISHKTLGTLLLSLPSKANSRHFSSQNISVKSHCPSLLSVCYSVCACVRACVRACVCVCVCIIMLEHLSIYSYISSSFLDNIFHLDVHYVCMLVQRFEPQGRRFTNFHY